MLENLGTLLYFTLAEMISFIILAMLAITNYGCFAKVSPWARKKIKSMVFNSLLTFIDGTFLLIVMTSAINVKFVVDGGIDRNSSYYISILCLLIYYS